MIVLVQRFVSEGVPLGLLAARVVNRGQEIN